MVPLFFFTSPFLSRPLYAPSFFRLATMNLALTHGPFSAFVNGATLALDGGVHLLSKL